MRMHARLFMHWYARRCKIGHNIEKRGVRAAVVTENVKRRVFLNKSQKPCLEILKIMIHYT